MTYPVFQAAGAFVESAAADVSPAWPAHQAGDLGLLIVHSNNRPCRLTVPAGFRELTCSPQANNVARRTDDSDLQVFWKQATSGAESAPTVQFNSDHVRAVIVTFRNCGTGQPITSEEGWNGANGSTTFTFQPGTTIDAEQLVVMIGSYGSDTAVARASGYANADLTNITEHVDSSSAIGAGAGIFVASGQKAAAGAFVAGSATFDTAGGGSALATITLALTGVSRNPDPTPWIAGIGKFDHRTTAGNVTPAWPPHEADDIGILIAESPDWPLATPAGWTEVSASPQRSGVDGTASSTNLSMWWKRAASGAEAAPSIAWVGTRVRAMIFTVRGCRTSGDPWHQIAGSNTNAGGSSSTCTMPSVTITEASALVVSVMSSSSMNQSSDVIGLSNPSLKSLTEKFDFSSDNGGSMAAGSGFYITAGRMTASGSSGNTTATLPAAFHQGRITLAFGPGAKEVSAEYGNFTLSGQSLSLERSRVIDALNGSFTLTGQAVETPINLHFTLNADAGLFPVSGQVADLERSFGRWVRRTSKDTGIWTKQETEE